MPKEVVIVGNENLDIIEPGFGGASIYIINIINSILKKGDIKITLIGILTKRSGVEVLEVLGKRDIRDSNPLFLLRLMLHVPFFKLHKSAIIHAQRPDMLIPFACFKPAYPKVCTLHGNPYMEIMKKKNILLRTIYQLIEMISLRTADKIIFVDRKTETFYLDRYKWLAGKTIVIPIGVNTQLFKPMKKDSIKVQKGFNLDDKIVLFVGRLVKEKGFSLLLESFEIVEKNEKNAKLIIVGIGNYENKIRELVNKLSLRNIKFAGAVEHDRIPEIINCADVFVLSSKYEGSPTVVKEALACGLPVVSTNVGDVSELIKNGKTGYVVNSRTSEEFASRILDILGSENSFTTDCVNTAMKYSWENIVRDTLEVYREA